MNFKEMFGGEKKVKLGLETRFDALSPEKQQVVVQRMSAEMGTEAMSAPLDIRTVREMLAGVTDSRNDAGLRVQAEEALQSAEKAN